MWFMRTTREPVLFILQIFPPYIRKNLLSIWMSFPLLNINYFLTIIVILTRTLEGSLQARRCRVFAHWKPTICYRINKIKTLIKMERQFCRLFADQYHSTVTGSSSINFFFSHSYFSFISCMYYYYCSRICMYVQFVVFWML